VLKHKLVNFFIESGHEKMGELATVIKQLRLRTWEGFGSYQFNDKADLRPLQTADVLAYEHSKRIKDMAQEPERKLRKSLMAIIDQDPRHKCSVVNKAMLRDYLSRMP
jgi:hypothetical protein